MHRHTPTRGTHSALALVFAIAAIMGIAGAAPLHAQYHHQGSRQFRQFRQPRPARMTMRQAPAEARQTPAPVERRPPPASSAARQNEQPRSQLDAIQRHDPQFHGQRGEHLAQWMNQHSNLTPEQQQQALDREPGFRNLPRQTQQRMHNHLAQLDAMSPRQRQRELSHIELMERLNPAQRQQFRGAMQQLGSLPPDQRRDVARSFRELREIPPGQRAAALNSGRYGWMNPEQRATLNHLLQIEPLLPAPGR